MNKKYLLSSVTAGIALLYANEGMAQCVTTQSCAALGYTETSCAADKKGVKCPFGNTWSCIPNVLCTSNYKYSCSGANQTGGSGTACNGRYTKCTCASGYEWKDGACSKVVRPVCAVGTLYYSDNTCSNSKVSGKALLGVVIYSNSPSVGGWIMTVKPVKTGVAWGGYGTDISGLQNYTSESSLNDIQASCTNTDKITTQGNSTKYPAAWAAKNYKPTGTPSGKSWCLPSGGLLKNALNDATKFAKINASITTAGGTKLGYVFQTEDQYSNNGIYYSEYVWSSSEYGSSNIWGLYYTSIIGSVDMGTFSKSSANDSVSVRPVMEF